MKISINIYVNFINISLQETLPDFKKKKKNSPFYIHDPSYFKKEKKPAGNFSNFFMGRWDYQYFL